MQKLLIISSCTGEKKVKLENELIQADFCNPSVLLKREKEINTFFPAAKLYTGMQHLRLMEGITLLREHLGHKIVDLHIMSAGYGMIAENRRIAPYEVTFNSMNAKQITEWSSHLKIPQSLVATTAEYELIIFLLGDKYLRAAQLKYLQPKAHQQFIFLAGKTSLKLIPDNNQFTFVELGPKEASSFSYGLVGLKGYLFKLFAQQATKAQNKGINLLQSLYEEPSVFLSFLQEYRRNSN